jgi:hypothetical protein
MEQRGQWFASDTAGARTGARTTLSSISIDLVKHAPTRQGSKPSAQPALLLVLLLLCLQVAFLSCLFSTSDALPLRAGSSSPAGWPLLLRLLLPLQLQAAPRHVRHGRKEDSRVAVIDHQRDSVFLRVRGEQRRWLLTGFQSATWKLDLTRNRLISEDNGLISWLLAELLTQDIHNQLLSSVLTARKSQTMTEV